MDGRIENVILGVVGNAVTSILAYGLGRGKALFSDGADEPGKLKLAVAEAVQHQIDSLQWGGDSPVEEVCLFIASPDAESLVRQVFSLELENAAVNGKISMLREAFVSELSWYLDRPREAVAVEGEKVFDRIVSICKRTLVNLSDKDSLAAHESLSTLRFNIIKDELAAIRRTVEFLRQGSPFSLQEFKTFEEKYRNQVAQRHGIIVPPNFDTARRVRIDDLYVASSFIRLSSGSQKEKLIDTDELMRISYRTVVLGNPGGGKSTFAQKLCFDLASKYPTRIVGNRVLTPILVVLRDYGSDKKSKGTSIVQFIESRCNANYQLNPPSRAFEYMLLNGRALVIFDGLDELLDTSYRQEISADIESFCSLHSITPVIVTSREVGYDQAPLDRTAFETYRLAAFNNDQVAEYARKWFALEPELTHEEGLRKAETFLAESAIVPDLRSNPLLLSLMCNIYRGENYIPRNKPDVYEKCAVMLFERWDKNRGINVQLPFEQHIKPAMMFLAHWIYSEESLQSGLSERRLIERATDYLTERRYDDRDEAREAATQFISFCRGRAWVFTDTGTTKDGEHLYQFTHRTFLEYFTAAYLVRTNPTPEQLITALLPKIIHEEWDVVCQLAFQLQNRSVEGAAEDLLTRLLMAREIYQKHDWQIISFSVRSLQFLVPSPRTLRQITAAAFEKVFESSRLEYLESRKSSAQEAAPEGLMGALLGALVENRKTITNELSSVFEEKLYRGTSNEGAIVAEICFHIRWCFVPRRNYQIPEEVSKYWYDWAESFVSANWPPLRELCIRHQDLACSAVNFGKFTLPEFVQNHGIEGVFSRHSQFRMFHHFSMWSLAESLLLTTLLHPLFGRSTVNVKDLEYLGQVFLTNTPPWLSLVEDGPMFYQAPYWEDELPSSEALTRDSLFGALVILATFVEAAEKTNHPLSWVEKIHIPSLTNLPIILTARAKPANQEEALTSLEQCDFSSREIDLLKRWLRKDISFVKGKIRVRKAKTLKTKRRPFRG